MPQDYFDLSGFAHRAIFDGVDTVWEVLARIRDVIMDYAKRHGDPRIQGTVSPGAWVDDDVYIGPGVIVEPGAYIQGPTVIGEGSVIRHGAYIRGDCIIGRHCIVGHATEMKKSIMLDESHAPHFNYVGDSIIGRRVNLGAGTRLSNFKSDGSLIEVQYGDRRIPTGLRKFGAILGDGVSTGCNCVASPGTLVGPETLIYPSTVLKGVYPARSIVKLRQKIEIVERKATPS